MPNYAVSGLASFLFFFAAGVLAPAYSIPIPPRAWSGIASDGEQVYVAGGGTCEILSCAKFGQDEVGFVEAINLSNMSSSSLASLSRARHSLGAVVVNGRVYVVGGDDGGGPINTVEVFNTAKNVWEQVEPLQVPRSKVAVGNLGDRIYAAGGLDGGNQCQPTSSVEVFDAEQGQWTSVTSLPTARWGAGAATVDGELYVIGGSRKCPHIIIEPLSVNESYDPLAGSWSSRAPMPSARWDLAVVTLAEKLYAIGGWDPISQSILATVEVYDPATDSWTRTGGLKTPRTGAGAVALEGRLYVIGGLASFGQTPEVEVYDPEQGEWKYLAGGRPAPGFEYSPSAPTASDAIQFVNTSTGSIVAQEWDFDGDGRVDSLVEDPTWSFHNPGAYPVTLRVFNPYGSDALTKDVVVGSDGQAPVVSEVVRSYPGFFIEGVTANNQFDIAVEWAGTPDSISVSVNGGAPATVTGTSSGGSFALNLNSIPPRWAPSEIEITATNAEGISGPPQMEYLHLFPYPAWLKQSLSLGGRVTFTAGSGEILGEVRWEFPNPRIEKVVTIPSYVPYLAGDLGIQETFAGVKGEFSSLGNGSLGLIGQTGFKALAGSVLGRVGGTGDLRLFPKEGLVLTGASFSLGLAGSIPREVGVIEAIPQLASFSTIGPIRWFNERAKIVGEISPSLDMTASFAADDAGDLVFREGTGTLDFALKATLEVDVISDRLTASGWVGGGGSMTLGVPEPFLGSPPEGVASEGLL